MVDVENKNCETFISVDKHLFEQHNTNIIFFSLCTNSSTIKLYNYVNTTNKIKNKEILKYEVAIMVQPITNFSFESI